MIKEIINLSIKSYNNRTSKILIKNKTSDTVCIFGSGESINNINNWNYVKSFDTIGFNNFMIHEFQTKFYFIEQYRAGDRNICHAKELISSKKEYLKKTILFLKPRKGNVFKNVLDKLGIKYEIYNLGEFYKFKDNYRYLFLKKYINNKYISKYFNLSIGGSSIEHYTLLAARMGYKKIILCGVDLNNTRYFYEDEKYSFINNEIVKISSGQIGAIHKTDDPNKSTSGLAVSEILRSYNDIFKDIGVNLYVENPTSKLAEFLPIYKL